MLVGLWTIGSAAQSLASRPSAGLTFLADSSGLTWATLVAGRQASDRAQKPSARPVASRVRGVGVKNHRLRLLIGAGGFMIYGRRRDRVVSQDH